ncbi:MAG TPA: ABC transporter permease [Vicinamibacterales bacterium]|nr:ABC transporter permease [Vicinamibacterales bacterium]
MPRSHPPRRLLVLISALVPADRRRLWLEEWEAEFAHHLQTRAVESRGRTWSARRLAGAVQHAVWLRWQSWRGGLDPRASDAWAGDLAGDFRYAIRACRRAPGFSFTVVMTLAVGLGLASAIFAFADGYLFRSLPFPGGDRTYYVNDPDTIMGGGLRSADAALLRHSALAGLGFVEWSVATSVGGQLVVDDRHVDLFAYEVSPGFRSTLRLPLTAGRDFSPDDHAAGAPLVAWLSDRFWRREFGGRPDVVGRMYRLESSRGATKELRIVGILAPQVSSFDLNNPPPDVVVPAQGPMRSGPNTYAFPLVQLPPGESPEHTAQRIAAFLQSEAPAAKPRTIRLGSLESSQVAGGKPTARLFFAGALLVLLLAAMNLVHLLVSRGATRGAEVATRAALGASPWRVARLFVAESLVLGAAGIGAALLVGRGLASLIAANVPQFPTAGRNLSLVPMVFDARVVGFAVALGLVMTIVGGIWPAWRALRGSLHGRARSSTGAGGPGAHRWARVILGSELTVATVVLVGAAFMGAGIYRYLTQPVGFDYRDRVWVSLADASGQPLPGTDIENAVRAIRSAPGVAAAGLDTVSVGRQTIDVTSGTIDNKDIRSWRVPPGFLQAWGVPVVRGRWFEDAEFIRSADDVAVIDERLARLAWPDAEAVGQTIRVNNVPSQVIGVVASRKSLLDREPSPTVYVPIRESDARSPLVAWFPGGAGEGASERLSASVAAVVPGARVKVTPVSFDRLFARSAGEAQFQAPVMGAFGVLAAVVAAIGVFGLVSYLVEQRRREFGIRMALGARQADVKRIVFREAVQPTVVGLILGSGCAYALESVVRSKVFGWQSNGPFAIVIVACGLLLVALVAALVPAARAVRVDPAVTLKAE